MYVCVWLYYIVLKIHGKSQCNDDLQNSYLRLNEEGCEIAKISKTVKVHLEIPTCYARRFSIGCQHSEMEPNRSLAVQKPNFPHWTLALHSGKTPLYTSHSLSFPTRSSAQSTRRRHKGYTQQAS